MRLQGKTAMITGASRNIAREVALTFAREGADLVLNTRASRPELESVAAQCRELGANTHTVLGDVTDPQSVRDMVDDGIGALGKIDVLVSSVAIRPHKPILEVSDDEWETVMRTNLFPAFYLIKAVLPGMMERRTGSIIAWARGIEWRAPPSPGARRQSPSPAPSTAFWEWCGQWPRRWRPTTCGPTWLTPVPSTPNALTRSGTPDRGR